MSGVLLIGIVSTLSAHSAQDTGFTIGEGGHTGLVFPPAETGSTTETDLPPLDTGPFGTFPTADTGGGFCDQCGGAADLAGDPGGTPCQEGCSTSGTGAAAWLVLAPLWLARRRPLRAPHSRSYST